jgi:uncharacterized protein (DUF1330 family)
MAKGYWVVAWRSVSDQAAVDRYVPPATAAIQAHGGRVVAGGVPARAYEQGLPSRLVIVEFETLQSAISAYESPAYQAALAHLAGVAERDVRIIEGTG